MLLPLTKRQKQILDFIEESSTKNGYSPSLEEIRNHFNLRAISTVHEHLENLKAKGYIKKEMNQARGIQVCNSRTNRQIDVPLKGKILKKVLNSIEGEDLPECIYFDNFFLKENRNYYSLLVSDDSLKEFGINKDSVLIIVDKKATKLAKICLVDNNGRQEISNTTSATFSKTNIIGSVVCVINKY